MDPFSAEGELVNIHTAFHQARYQEVIDYDTSALSSTNTLPARILKLRAQCALHQYDEVLSSVSSSEASKTPDLAAVRAFAKHIKDQTNEAAVAEAEQLAGSQADNLSVQLLCGSVLAGAGKTEQALTLLGRHQGSLDAVALIIQIHLTQNRTDLAQKEARTARSFAQDALLVNLAESWIGLREGGEKYQQAFYVFEELAQAPSSQSAAALTAQAVSELHLGRYPEAETALQQCLALDKGYADAIANTVVLNTILGKEAEASEGLSTLEGVDKAHPMLEDVARRKEMFDAACAKYRPKFEP